MQNAKYDTMSEKRTHHVYTCMFNFSQLCRFHSCTCYSMFYVFTGFHATKKWQQIMIKCLMQ